VPVPLAELEHRHQAVIDRSRDQSKIEAVAHELEHVLAGDFIDVGFGVGVPPKDREDRPVGSIRAQAAVLANIFKVLGDRRVHGQTGGLDRRGGFGLSQNAGLNGLQLDGLGARGGEEEVEALDGLSAAPARLIPFEVVAAFGMVFIPACDPDVVADNASVALNDAGEWSLAVHLDELEDVDAIRVPPGSGHGPEPSLRVLWTNSVERRLDQIWTGNSGQISRRNGQEDGQEVRKSLKLKEDSSEGSALTN